MIIFSITLRLSFGDCLSALSKTISSLSTISKLSNSPIATMFLPPPLSSSPFTLSIRKNALFAHAVTSLLLAHSTISTPFFSMSQVAQKTHLFSYLFISVTQLFHSRNQITSSKIVHFAKLSPSLQFTNNFTALLYWSTTEHFCPLALASDESTHSTTYSHVFSILCFRPVNSSTESGLPSIAIAMESLLKSLLSESHRTVWEARIL